MANDPNVLNGIDDLRKFLAEHPDAQIASINRISVNNITGEQTSQTIWERTPSYNQQRQRQETRQNEALEKAKQNKKKYEKALEEWEKDKRDVEDRRSAEITKALAVEEEKRREQIHESFCKAVRSAAKDFAAAELEEKRLQEDIGALGGFHHSEKKQIQSALEAAKNRKSQAENAAREAKETKESDLKSISSYLKSVRGRLADEIADRFKLPPKPAKSSYLSYQDEKLLNSSGSTGRRPTAKQIENDGFKDDILCWMDEGQFYSAEEVMNGVPAIVNAGIGINRVSSLLSQLCDAGWVNRTVNNGLNYYSLANSSDSMGVMPTARQLENDGFKSDILAWMDPGKLYNAEDIMNGVPTIVNSGMSINRVSALLTQLRDAGSLNLTIDKRKNYYSLAD